MLLHKMLNLHQSNLVCKFFICFRYARKKYQKHNEPLPIIPPPCDGMIELDSMASFSFFFTNLKRTQSDFEYVWCSFFCNFKIWKYYINDKKVASGSYSYEKLLKKKKKTISARKIQRIFFLKSCDNYLYHIFVI